MKYSKIVSDYFSIFIPNSTRFGRRERFSENLTMHNVGIVPLAGHRFALCNLYFILFRLCNLFPEAE